MLVGITTVFAAPAGAATTAVRCDFDSDGVADLAVGVPGENGYGAVDVLYSTAAPAILLEGWLPAASAYGAALTCGDFDADGVGDLAVGAPGAYAAAGKVFVYSGAAGVGLGDMTMFSQGSGTPGSYAADDRLGWSLASGDLGGDGYDDLVVGLPGDELVGSVLVIRGGAHGLRFDRSVAQLFGGDQDRQGFGWSLAVGQFEAGGGAELAVGAPYADAGSVAQGGLVHTFTDGRRADRVFDQGDTQIGPGVELHDRFGWSLAAGDLDGDGHDDLAVGTPFEDVGAVLDAGEVDVLSGGTDGLGGPDTTVDVVVPVGERRGGRGRRLVRVRRRGRGRGR